jgi:hypothetical protein
MLVGTPQRLIEFSMTFRAAIYTIVIALFAMSCSPTVEQIEIVPVPPDSRTPASERTSTYDAALALVLDALERELTLPRVEVSLVLFPSRRSFEQGLLQIGYTKTLARSASSFNAIGGARAVLMNASLTDGLTRTQRIRLIAHEVVHTLQYQLGGGTRGASEQWLREGFAEWVACRVTTRLGLASFDSLRDDLIGELSGAPFGMPHAPFEKLSTFPQWVEAHQRYETPLYAQAFIAAELLVEMRGTSAVVGYFERFKDTQDRRRAFADAFGLEPADFERAFTRRWHETVSRARAQR